MKKLILLGACLLAFSACPAQTVAAAAPDIVVVRIWESASIVRAVITRGEGKTETLEFKNGSDKKDLAESGQGHYKMLYKLYQEGYALQSTFSDGGNHSTSTLLFVKAK